MSKYNLFNKAPKADDSPNIERQLFAAASVAAPRPVLLPAVDPLAAVVKQMARPAARRNKQELWETNTVSLTSHSCLATNKQILFEDDIKHFKLFSEDTEVWNSLTTPISDHIVIYL